MDNTENLFAEFPEISESEWIEKVEKDLKGRALEELDWAINTDLKIAPFYHSIDHIPNVPNNKSDSNTWEIGEDIFVKDAKVANRQLINTLENGVNALKLIFESDLSEKEFETLFESVELAFISIHFLIKKSGSTLPNLNTFHSYISKKGIDANQIKGSIDHMDDDQILDLYQFTSGKLPNFKIKTIEIPGAANAAISQSLAKGLADGCSFLDKLNEKGISLAHANDRLQFSFSVGTSFFVEIAKIRAFKILWANVMKAYGIDNGNIPAIEANFSPDSFGEDFNTNIIRATTQTMSAVLGGVDRLTVLPSDTNSGETTAFSRRIARNVQHLLVMESFLDRVVDPAKGSYYIEKLTEKIAEATWAAFQKMELKEKT